MIHRTSLRPQLAAGGSQRGGLCWALKNRRYPEKIPDTLASSFDCFVPAAVTRDFLMSKIAKVGICV
jgi:hypothetical protein